MLKMAHQHLQDVLRQTTATCKNALLEVQLERLSRSGQLASVYTVYAATIEGADEVGLALETATQHQDTGAFFLSGIGWGNLPNEYKQGYIEQQQIFAEKTDVVFLNGINATDMRAIGSEKITLA